MNHGIINQDMNKILGRGYRQCSHKIFHLKKLTIYNYIAISDKESIKRIFYQFL